MRKKYKTINILTLLFSFNNAKCLVIDFKKIICISEVIFIYNLVFVYFSVMQIKGTRVLSVPMIWFSKDAPAKNNEFQMNVLPKINTMHLL